MREVLIGLAAAGVIILLWQQNNLFPIVTTGRVVFFPVPV